MARFPCLKYLDLSPILDTTYVLAYSIIMLNMDVHKPKIKHRMTKADFIQNICTTNDGDELPEEFLSSVFNDIQNEEIGMSDDLDRVTLPDTGTALAHDIANVRRDLQKEACNLQSSGMANKAEVC